MAQKDCFLTWLAALIGLSCVTSTSEYLLRANEFIKQTKMQGQIGSAINGSKYRDILLKGSDMFIKYI